MTKFDDLTKMAADTREAARADFNAAVEFTEWLIGEFGKWLGAADGHVFATDVKFEEIPARMAMQREDGDFHLYVAVNVPRRNPQPAAPQAVNTDVHAVQWRIHPDTTRHIVTVGSTPYRLSELDTEPEERIKLFEETLGLIKESITAASKRYGKSTGMASRMPQMRNKR